MSELQGLILLYLIPGAVGVLFWCWPIKRLIALWVGRDTMLTLIPKRQHVHHTEKIFRLTK